MITVIAIFDIGKTNKKLFLFDEDYKIVFESNECFAEIKDEDGEGCEDLQKLTDFITKSLDEIFSKKDFDIQAINFSAYGASFVYIDQDGKPLTPLYNYLKNYPASLQQKFYADYGGEEKFSLQTASPVLGSLNSGMQLYRIKYEKPEIFRQIKHALHLPQFLSYLVTKKTFSDITSIGCHTNLWDFKKNDYHQWVGKEKIEGILAPIASSDSANEIFINEKKVVVGIGLHDSSAALLPYLAYFHEPFILISTGTWCISLNPFNEDPLTVDELQQDCLCYLTHEGKQVKSSRLFLGHEHEQQIKRLSVFFKKPLDHYAALSFDENLIDVEDEFDGDNLGRYKNYQEAYHCFMNWLVKKQFASTQLIMGKKLVSRIFIDGGFSQNTIYMSLLASIFNEKEVYAAAVPQASAIGAAMVIHRLWNKKPLPENLIQLKKFIGNKIHSSL